ncbi:hypothetical protein C7B80_33080 [Cyanosarcina cf. burmensis CCALA 770]|nr:hypothetical protein C7B80_33080 [Cyanosarcina cf. burmensis CCALA 770]
MSNQIYTLWHGSLTPCKILADWIEGAGWEYAGGKPERYWSEKRRVWRVQIKECSNKTCICDRTQYTRPETIYPSWAGGAAIDNRITRVTGTLYKSPDFSQPVEEIL